MVLSSALVGHYIFPKFVHIPLRMVEDRYGDNMRDALQIGIVFGTMISFAYTAHLFKAPLLGPFCAGLAFADIPRTEQVWTHNTKAITKWMIRIFFAFNVGCQIKSGDLFFLESILERHCILPFSCASW